MHALHNAARLRRYLPRLLTKPKPLFSDRRLRHDELADQVRITQTAKRKARKEKAAATWQKNAQKTALPDTATNPSAEAGNKRRCIDNEALAAGLDVESSNEFGGAEEDVDSDSDMEQC
ncbi:hypothetical protein VKT23_000958 [Stygiomarasmius scandens]|uniref:Uncharacterized protein n=1 Tax=Marasmiellus scandens TaxID=2682957 RepID=A0ABR1K8W4_9AGAR